MESNETLDQKGGCRAAAHNYLKRGLVPIPVEPHGKKALVKWKLFQEHPPTQKEVDAWWDRWPDANVALITGAASGFIVVDIDSETGERAYQQLLGDVPTPTNITGRGRQRFFQCLDVPVRNRVKVFDGVDIRGDGGYTVVPPSIHPSGAQYHWDDEHGRGLDCPFAALPAAFLELLTHYATGKHPDQVPEPRPEVATGKIATPFRLPDAISEGARNDTLFQYACSLRAQGLDQAQILAFLAVANVERCASALDDDELEGIVASAAPYAEGHNTDLGNALRLVRQHGGKLRYVPEWGTWLAWNGCYWERDRTGEVMRLAKSTVRQMYAEASSKQDSGQRAALVKWALASESEKRLQAMVALARSEAGIATAVESLDQDQWLLNVANGTIDLRSGKLRAHNPDDLITRMIHTDYDPDATAPRWDAFLYEIMDGDKSLIGYMQRLVGYTLTGDVSEQVMPFLHGFGANGKTTFLNAVLNLMGPYAKQGDPQLLMTRSSDAHPTNMADLQGSRMVACSEVDDGRSFAEATVKQLTGGDQIKARFMRADFFEFAPTHKLWFSANHQPIVKGTDYAIWRRIRLIPFEVTIPEGVRDRDLPAKLRAELPGILAWAVRGCLGWQAGGLQEPERVRAASDAYRTEMDVIGQFIDEACVVDPAAEVEAKRLYGTYGDWCEASGLKACAMQSFGRRMKERGYDKRRSTGGRYRYRGIAAQDRG